MNNNPKDTVGSIRKTTIVTLFFFLLGIMPYAMDSLEKAFGCNFEMGGRCGGNIVIQSIYGIISIVTLFELYTLGPISIAFSFIAMVAAVFLLKEIIFTTTHSENVQISPFGEIGDFIVALTALFGSAYAILLWFQYYLK